VHLGLAEGGGRQTGARCSMVMKRLFVRRQWMEGFVGAVLLGAARRIRQRVRRKSRWGTTRRSLLLGYL
jgi:hypothetical protein